LEGLRVRYADSNKGLRLDAADQYGLLITIGGVGCVGGGGGDFSQTDHHTIENSRYTQLATSELRSWQQLSGCTIYRRD